MRNGFRKNFENSTLPFISGCSLDANTCARQRVPRVCTRIVYIHDLVTQVPVTGSRHNGNIVVIRPDENYVEIYLTHLQHELWITRKDIYICVCVCNELHIKKTIYILYNLQIYSLTVLNFFITRKKIR